MDILYLPTSLEVNGKAYDIDSDFRTCIKIFQYLEDNQYNDYEKMQLMLGLLFVNDILEEDIDAAITQASIFLDCGRSSSENSNGLKYGRLYSWTQDLQYIIAAANASLGFSCRGTKYLHWWDFMTALMECKECTLSTLIYQRKLRKQGKQSKADKEWWTENKEIAELENKVILTTEEQTALDKFNKLLG
ncbi:Gp15 family bacteriophage protein [Aminipila sp.]|uniref:Gp15 family bacteriophage protein n=1 Tax=Aminipila sp. TaxID=2060095 RepID=UPI00289D0419|nr:Gp15 family bacteriophage protein [Aminipila sp.]